ncbi:MAG: glycerate kinase [Desulfobacterales bacterium]|uniref:Glycerate kinase n=1 Tax=Candidatus Desulfaltia bathyphila TaxID=2841697 RepID=A0A8J6T8T4_9BACT|nr:glycerate kinase [Candidatus Desulfaltia bathyphila]MBL7195253.1 glycerate kinase [Desulfobacterales bacterium]MBL7207311.1 glycerate kinase [Desulfobacterales bacterium]
MRKDAETIFYAGLKAVEPGAAVKRYCRIEDDHLFIGDKPYDLSRIKNIFVVGAGKATAPMAAEIENILGDRVTKGIINVKYGHTSKLGRIKLIEAGHPVPDKNGRQGAEAIIDLVNNAGKNDLVLCLISGGGSALLPLPFPGLTLKDKQDTIKILLSCGAAIHEINALRKHISMIKGGRLAQAAHPASLVSLILSDVVGDNPDVIASGPTVPDSSGFDDCMKIIDKYNLRKKLPKPVVRHIKDGISGRVPETPKTGDPAFEKAQNIIIGSNIEAIMAAKQKSESFAYNTIVLSSMIEGDTTQMAHVHSAIAREIIQTGNPIPSPACILSGGETTVTIKGKGLGGRNQEFALAAAIDIAGAKNIVILSGGTDGTDGPTDAAGAVADTNTLSRAMAMGLNPGYFLENNDSYHFFQKLGDLLITGPTNTNVMDIRIMLVT